MRVPRGLWRSRNVPKRLWDVLELFYIEMLFKIYKKTLRNRLVVTKRGYPGVGENAAYITASTDAAASSIDAHDMACGWV